MSRTIKRRSRRVAGTIRQLPWQSVTNAYPPAEPLSADQVEAIHDASLTILERMGIRVLHRGARDLFAAAGADVEQDAQIVRMDRALVAETIARVPGEFSLRARNAERNLMVGGTRLVITSVGGPPFCHDLDRGRRPGNYADLCEYLKLEQSLNVIHMEGGGPIEPVDLPAATRHLDLYLAQIRLLDKNWKPLGLGRERAADAIEMACILYDTDREGLAREPALFCVINTNSPRQIDAPMCEGLMEMAAAGQPVCITPFTLAGAMGPVTLAGALALQNAEALAGIVLCQLVRPGTPVVYGAFTSNVDMKSGSPAFGTPEYAKATQACGQLARRYRLPYRSSNTTSANSVDAQAAYESEMSLWGAITGHANVLNQGAGWLEGGLTASFEKLIVDAEMLQMMVEHLKPLQVDAQSLALDTIAEVDPGGHFFATQHTLDRYENAFYAPLVSDWSNYETWLESGSQSTTQRANAIWKQLLREYQQPALDAGIDEALADYVTRRKREIEKGSPSRSMS
jgi:trimethylamine--corrinoid protein Co-methyltransferase